jgi:hypothetical protein
VEGSFALRCARKKTLDPKTAMSPVRSYPSATASVGPVLQIVTGGQRVMPPAWLT